MCKFTQFLAVTLISLFATSASAEWDFHEDGDSYTLLLNTDRDIDITRVEIKVDGSRLRFDITEYVNGEVVNEDDFDERFSSDGQDTLRIDGTGAIEIVEAHPDTMDRVKVIVDAEGGDDVINNVAEAKGGAGNDMIYNAVIANGQNDDDWLVAGPQTEVLLGREGDDRIEAPLATRGVLMKGGPGDDLIIGGDYADLIYGEEGNDRLYGGPGDDEIWGGREDSPQNDSDKIFGEGGKDILRGGHDDDLIIGGSNDDAIYGGEGSDILIGQGGKDVIDAGPVYDPGDWLFGQTGSDVFVAVGWPSEFFNDYSHQDGDYWMDVRPRRR